MSPPGPLVAAANALCEAARELDRRRDRLPRGVDLACHVITRYALRARRVAREPPRHDADPLAPATIDVLCAVYTEIEWTERHGWLHTITRRLHRVARLLRAVELRARLEKRRGRPPVEDDDTADDGGGDGAE